MEAASPPPLNLNRRRTCPTLNSRAVLAVRDRFATPAMWSRLSSRAASSVPTPNGHVEDRRGHNGLRSGPRSQRDQHRARTRVFRPPCRPANEAGAAHLRLRGLSWSRPSTVPGGFKVRMTGTVTGLGSHRPFSIYFDVLGFAHGAAVVFLFAEGWDDPPLPSIERRLFSLLYGRAGANRL